MLTEYSEMKVNDIRELKGIKNNSLFNIYNYI